jgi:hypothetical protein
VDFLCVIEINLKNGMFFSGLSVPMGAYPAAQGGMVYGQVQAGALSSGTNPPYMAVQDTEDTQGQDKQEGVTEPPDNELIDFDAF